MKPLPKLPINAILPKMQNASFSQMHMHVKELTGNFLQKLPLNGAPTAIVFSEGALFYEFSTSHVKTRNFCLSLQKLLSPSMCIAFSVLEMADDIPRHTGWLVGKDFLDFSYQRVHSFYELYFLKRKFMHVSQGEQMANYWDDELCRLGLLMEGNREKFARISFNGMQIELRVCSDAASKPLIFEPSVITLVPAHNIRPSIANKLALKRKFAIINDSGGALFEGKFAQNIVMEKG